MVPELSHSFRPARHAPSSMMMALFVLLLVAAGELADLGEGSLSTSSLSLPSLMPSVLTSSSRSRSRWMHVWWS
jgi:hypothetical protein